MSADERPNGIPAPDTPEIAAGALTLGYNAALNRVLPEITYIPANLAAAGALVGVARITGCEADDLGLTRAHAKQGATLGLTTAVAVSCAIALAVAWPTTRRFFEQERTESTAESVYHAAVRIPFGTALAEELMFRGAIFGILTRRRSSLQAALISSALFGIWHVLPTHDAYAAERAVEQVGTDGWGQAATVAGTVAFTTVAGLGFCWLRTRSRSLAAPVVVHAAVNTVAYLGSWWASGRA